MISELGDIQATLFVGIKSARGLRTDPPGRCNPFVRVKFNHVERETDFVPDQTDPAWEEGTAFEFACSNISLSKQKLQIQVWNCSESLQEPSTLIGFCEMELQSLVPHDTPRDYKLYRSRKDTTEVGTISLIVKFTSASPRLFELKRPNMDSLLEEGEEEEEEEPVDEGASKRNAIVALILMLLMLVAAILIFYPRTPEVSFRVALSDPIVTKTISGNGDFTMLGNFTAFVYNPGNVGFDVRSLSMNTYYTFVNTKNELDGYKISPDTVTDLGKELDVYVPNRETVAVRMRLNVTALVSSQLLQSMQSDCTGEDAHLKFTFFGDGDAGWYGSFGGQSFSISVESKAGCSGVEMPQ